MRAPLSVRWLVRVCLLTASCASAGPPQVLDSSQAYQNGYRDGYATGRNDARRRIWPNPQRTGAFRSAHHGYDRRCQCAPQYEENYRTGFLDGYEHAYDATRAAGRTPGGQP